MRNRRGEGCLLSTQSRFAAVAVAVLYFLLGVLLFVAPDWASANFAWNVSPLVAMTIGGWCLGNAWAAFVVAKRWRLMLTASGLVYLGLFGIFETGVAIGFADKLKLGHWLGWLYLMTLALNLLAALLWLVEWLTHRPIGEHSGDRLGPVSMALVVIFVLVVAFLGFYGLLAPEGSRGLGGTIFPQVVSMFTLRAFGAFYLAVALPPIMILIVRDRAMMLSHALLSWGLILFITLAALVFIGEFDFANRPRQWIYIGIYLAVGFVTAIYLLRNPRSMLP
jgi:hypothetical protein